MGLYDMMMIKDNHIAAAGGIRCGYEQHMKSLLRVQ
jgi:nicotinate-nucleotide pyrophosphorylase